ncbi:hypothetical protein [Stakelama marina]|uniref:Uncharacterized protein n=1 Tax=Stakelama marina TaxID=2826939 RepID=A0A8T4ILC1_9SPHN|nr:hypothetical protein [Stakelama marina]MBR0553925.1 hypothetical protein [Stakelama marina]
MLFDRSFLPVHRRPTAQQWRDHICELVAAGIDFLSPQPIIPLPTGTVIAQSDFEDIDAVGRGTFAKVRLYSVAPFDQSISGLVRSGPDELFEVIRYCLQLRSCLAFQMRLRSMTRPGSTCRAAAAGTPYQKRRPSPVEARPQSIGSGNIRLSTQE